MEVLQVLKFSLKRDQLNVNEWFPNASEKDMIPDNLTPDYTTGQPITPGLLTELADAVGGSNIQNILDRIIAATKPKEVDNHVVIPCWYTTFCVNHPLHLAQSFISFV